jgi:UDP-GlcNAc:undecaprenyl-phosphate/decaprenyl-phosphate GlcNAc-1-phosphate transferase
MTEAVRLGGAFATAFLLTALATPLARSLAIRTGFLDHPIGFKGHRAATPYLGGMAVIFGWVVAAVVFGGAFSDFAWLTVCALGLLVVGTLDDRFRLPISPRLIAVGGSGVLLWATGPNWEVLHSDAGNLALTVFWVVAITNAFNLMDNIDGSTATVAGVSSAGVAAIALGQSDVLLAGFALALAGACLGFLPRNLSRPARIFLGDGGSMPIGFLVAGLVMAIPPEGLGWATVPALALVVALPIFDTTLVVLSRYRRRQPILQGARDHLTHRLLSRFGSERRVALVLASAQAFFCGLAYLLSRANVVEVSIATALLVVAGLIYLASLELQFTGARRLEPKLRRAESSA